PLIPPELLTRTKLSKRKALSNGLNSQDFDAVDTYDEYEEDDEEDEQVMHEDEDIDEDGDYGYQEFDDDDEGAGVEEEDNGMSRVIHVINIKSNHSVKEPTI